jgi:hypothetical protein
MISLHNGAKNMIKFSFNIVNPWAKDCPMKDYYYRHKNLTKNKSFEIQISSSSPYNWFRLFVNLAWRGESHAGPEFELELGKYSVNVKIYDHRHWDYEKGSWEVYDSTHQGDDE